MASQEIRDPWPLVDKVLHDPELLPPDLAATVGPSAAKLWDSLKPERRALLQLLARFEITADQATRWFVPEERERAGIAAPDADIIANPYLCFEAGPRAHRSDLRNYRRSWPLPRPAVTSAVPVPQPSRCAEAIDPRRVRGLCVATLDHAAGEGHTFLPQSWLVQRVRDLDVVPQCAIGGDWVDAFGSTLLTRLTAGKMADGAPAWQLNEYARSRELISARVRRRLAGKRHAGQHDWRSLIDAQLPPFADATDPETEELGRREKASALEEIYRSRFSVLIGPAGTGKTSLSDRSAICALRCRWRRSSARPDRQGPRANAKTREECASLYASAVPVEPRPLRPADRSGTKSPTHQIASAASRRWSSTSCRCSPRTSSPRRSTRSRPPLWND